MKITENRVITPYDVDQFKRKAINIAVFAGLILIIIVIVSMALRPPPSLPPPAGNFQALNLTIRGTILIPPGIRMLSSGKESYYLQDLRIVVELPDIPLAIEKKGKEIALTGSGQFTLALDNFSVMRAPNTLNVRVNLEGCEESYMTGIAVSSPTGEIRIPGITLRPELIENVRQ
jgi:hypothetical protein